MKDRSSNGTSASDSISASTPNTAFRAVGVDSHRVGLIRGQGARRSVARVLAARRRHGLTGHRLAIPPIRLLGLRALRSAGGEPRCPADSVLLFTPADLESWLQWRDAERPVPAYVEDELRGYLACGLLCFGFARAVCMTCRTGFVVAFSCKGRGVCPSCNGRHTAQTAAHVADHVIPPVPVRQWAISVPKRLRGFLADRPRAVAALTKIFLDEIERLLCAAAGGTSDPAAPASARPRLGGVSFLHRFGSALNHHVHLHACVTDGVFVPAADDAERDAPPAFLPALTERVRRRVIRWFRMQRLLDVAAAADMLTWENSGFSINASVRITLIDRDVPSYFQSLEHLLRSSARPPFALERLSVSRGADGQIARIRYVLPRHKAANWVGL